MGKKRSKGKKVCLAGSQSAASSQATGVATRSILVCEDLPSKRIPYWLSVEKAGQKFGIQWNDLNSGPGDLVALCAYDFPCVIAKMGDDLGYGAFAAKNIPDFKSISYGGTLEPQGKDDIYGILIDKNKGEVLTARNFGNEARFFQHAFSREKLMELYDFDLEPEEINKIAVKNMMLHQIEYAGKKEMQVFTLENIPEGDILTWDYGLDYWLRRVPKLFYKDGTLVDPGKYKLKKVEINIDCDFNGSRFNSQELITSEEFEAHKAGKQIITRISDDNEPLILAVVSKEEIEKQCRIPGLFKYHFQANIVDEKFLQEEIRKIKISFDVALRFKELNNDEQYKCFVQKAKSEYQVLCRNYMPILRDLPSLKIELTTIALSILSEEEKIEAQCLNDLDFETRAAL